MNIKQKFGALFGSVRFWIITLTAIVTGLQAISTHSGFDLNTELQIIKLWLLAVVGIGTLDSVATKFSLPVKQSVKVGK